MKSSIQSFLRLCRSAAVVPLCVLALALGACNGTAVVTLTSTASTDNFLAYRVALVSVQLQGSGGSSGLTVLPQTTTVDFAQITDLSEVLGVAGVNKGNYKSAVITLDYSAAQIVYDDGSLTGLALTPVDANGQALGKVQVTATLDPSASFVVTAKGASQLALDFKMSASNLVNVAAKTLTVTPLIAASAAPIDAKQVRIRGPLSHIIDAGSTSVTGSTFTMSVLPFNSTTGASSALTIVPGDATTYEVNGEGSTGADGLTQLAALGSGTLTVAYGSLVSADSTTTSTTTTTTDGDTTTDASSVATTVTFAATTVLAGGSVQGAGLDRVSGTVSARSGNTVTVEDGTLIAVDGTETFLGGTSVVILGPSTLVTAFGQGGTEIDSLAQVSVGSVIDAFGTVTAATSTAVTLDASSGRVRLDLVDAAGIVNVQGSGDINVTVSKLGGRSVSAFDFLGSNATPAAYVIYTGALDLTNATAGQPVTGTGFTNSFAAALPNFTAISLLDATTLVAQLVVDWPAGTATPFTTYDTSSIEIALGNASIGTRHTIQQGAKVYDAVALGTALIAPNSTSSATVYTIGHAHSGTTENFNTYSAFITQLQSELNGVTLATSITATGIYTESSFTLSASSITLFLNN